MKMSKDSLCYYGIPLGETIYTLLNSTHYRRRKEGERGAESLFKEIMAENLPNTGAELNI